jgi:nickel/cobalt exporter
MFAALLTLFGQGILHGLGPDHCLAIGALSAAGGGMRQAAGVSLRFGVGHTVVLASGAVVAAVTGLAIPARWESGLEVVGGVSLLALGCWTVLSKRALLPHAHGAFSSHTHGAEGHTHDHEGAVIPSWAGGRFQALAGAVFGLSGVRALLLLLPLMARERTASLVLGVALFGAGVVLSMFAVGWFAQRAAATARRWERGLRVPVGVASMLCGAWWVVSHV